MTKKTWIILGGCFLAAGLIYLLYRASVHTQAVVVNNSNTSPLNRVVGNAGAANAATGTALLTDSGGNTLTASIPAASSRLHASNVMARPATGAIARALPVNAASVMLANTTTSYSIPAAGSTQDVLNGINTLIQNISTQNNNYTPFLNSYNSLGAAYTLSAASTLWGQVNTFFWGQVNSLLSAMTVVVTRQNLTSQATALLNSATGNYSISSFANSLVALTNTCQQEITNEFIEALDASIYGGFGNYTNYFNNIYNGSKHSGAPTAYDQQHGWEYLKWQISNDSNLAAVPYQYTTPASPQTTIIGNAAFANDGYGIVSDATGLYFYNWDSSGIYGFGSNHVFASGESIYSTFTNYQLPGPYGPQGQNIYGKLFKCSSYYQQQQAITTFMAALPNLFTLSQSNAAGAADSAADNNTVITIVSTIAKLI